MATVKLNGVGVALVTPFTNSGSIDYDSLESLIEHVIKGGCDYIVSQGTTAETPTLTLKEKRELDNFIPRIVKGRIPVIVGIGGNNTAAIIDELRTRPLKEYDAVLSVTPYYNRPTQEGLYQHFKNLSDVSPLPLILYNVPGRTGVNLTSHTTLRLANYSKNIIGIKEASGKMDQVKEILSDSPGHFSVICGDDSNTCQFIKNGAPGVISVLANAVPHIVKELVELSLNKISEADLLHEKLKNLVSLLFEEGNPAGIKALLHQMGLCNNNLRLPLVPVSQYVWEKIKKESSLILN